MMVTTFLEQEPCTSAMMASDWLEQASVSANQMAAGMAGHLYANVRILITTLYKFIERKCSKPELLYEDFKLCSNQMS